MRERLSVFMKTKLNALQKLIQEGYKFYVSSLETQS